MWREKLVAGTVHATGRHDTGRSASASRFTAHISERRGCGSEHSHSPGPRSVSSRAARPSQPLPPSHALSRTWHALASQSARPRSHTPRRQPIGLPNAAPTPCPCPPARVYSMSVGRARGGVAPRSLGRRPGPQPRVAARHALAARVPVAARGLPRVRVRVRVRPAQAEARIVKK